MTVQGTHRKGGTKREKKKLKVKAGMMNDGNR